MKKEHAVLPFVPIANHPLSYFSLMLCSAALFLFFVFALLLSLDFHKSLGKKPKKVIWEENDSFSVHKPFFLEGGEGGGEVSMSVRVMHMLYCPQYLFAGRVVQTIFDFLSASWLWKYCVKH